MPENKNIFRQDVTPQEIDDFIRNFYSRSFPDGLDTQIFSYLVDSYDRFCVSLRPDNLISFWERVSELSICFDKEYE